MKDLDKDKKADVLVSALEERYKAMHTIRERVQSIGVWALGLMFGAAGWLLQSDVVLSPTQKLLYIVGIVGAVAVLRLKYLADLETGFKSQQQIAVRIEKTLGFFTAGFFDSEAESIYPKKWEEAGSKNGDGKFFYTSYLLLYVGVAALLLAILFNGCGNSNYRYHHWQTESFFVR